MKHYDASQIRVINVPELEQLKDGQCCRSYLYNFVNSLPELDILAQIARSLKHRFFFDKARYYLQEDVAVFASINIQKISDREAKVNILTKYPEESPVLMFGIRILPRKIEEKLGTIETIQGLPRDRWIY